MDFEAARINRAYSRDEVPVTEVRGSRSRGQAEQALSDEFVIDMVNRLPLEGQPGTPLGFMMGLGLTNQDTDFRMFKKPARGFGSTVYGAYVPEAEGFEYDKEVLSSMLTKNESSLVRPYEGEGDIVFYTPQHIMEQRGVADRMGESDTFAHELFHKGSVIALPIIEDMLQEKGGLFKLLSLNKDKLREFKQSFEDDRSHSKYLDAMDKYYFVGGDVSKLSKEEQQTINDVKVISMAVKNYLTEDRKTQYGIRTPTEAARPKKKGMFEK